MAWFILTGSNPTDSQDYDAATPSGCTGTNKICAVQANPDSNNKPELTDALKDEMILALHNRSASANVQLKS
ncbi:hypothetical protein HCX49_01970 [Sphingobacterium kitahiroshimense]|uniref:hypothetical protein n=1 Tax=Sphingobacterium sp. B16(2022) TaxID=2914044 RepID=UPI00143B167A|nr:hypothetical protein [Sphingobacterium sp. B16(2022)]NJI71963.1 hypothetical protein [Sphingobacterium sp. B16(2022)]